MKESKLALLTALFSGVATLMLMLFVWERGLAIHQLKKEIAKLENSLTEAGFDLAYDDLRFTSLSPFAIMTVKNLRFFSQDGSNYYEWKIPALKINAGLFSAGKISAEFSRQQFFQKGLDVYEADFPEIKLYLSAGKDGLKSVAMEGKTLTVRNLFSIEKLSLSSQRSASRPANDLAPFFENRLNIQNVSLDKNIDFPLKNTISRIYLNASIIGPMNSHGTYGESIDEWLHLGGMVDIRRLIVNWAPLLMVGRGDLYFNENLEPNIHLTTSSKALIYMMDELEKNKILDRKGTFVAKILLNNKSFKISPNDQYYTVTAPININNEEILIENIPVKKFGGQENKTPKAE